MAGSRHQDWLVLDSWRVLHRVQDWTADSERISGPGRSVCGVTGRYTAPGLFSRMGLPRCKHCCNRLGIPHGDGNTLNAGIKEPE